MSAFKVPQLAWHGSPDLELKFPNNWLVEVCNMKGYDRPALSRSQIASAILNPLGSPPLHILARNKKQVAIIFDDIQRATRTAEVIPFILQELAESGIPDSSIRFVCANGCHAAMNRSDLAKKVGEEVLRRYPVYNHNVFGNCLDIGVTSLGTRLSVNAEVMSSDLKVAIGSIVPHVLSGFGGGAKIILPGICHFQTCMDFHKSGSAYALQHKDRPVGMGVLEDNPLRQDMEEAAKMVGLDFKIDTLMNARAETAAVYAGSLKAAYAAAVNDARGHYDTVQASDQDIVIANTFAKVAECDTGLEIAFPSLRAAGGEVVLIANCPEGHVAHYLAGAWGKTTRSNFGMKCTLPSNVRRLIIFDQYPDLSMVDGFVQKEKVTIQSKWEEVLAILQKAHPGEARVAVYPSSDIQYCSTNPGSKALGMGAED
jgi:nickel-dependent lactate racemase